MGFPRRLHGESTLDDPQLVKGMCPTCKQERDWKITQELDGSQIKTCKKCGLKVRVKAPKKEENMGSNEKGGTNTNGGVVGFFQKVMTSFGKEKK
jgi:hypothetical protein